MADRYYSDEPLQGDSVTLRGSEAHHLLHVMRAKIGTEIIVFDGRGGEWWAEVAQLKRAEVELRLRAHRAIERELAAPLTLAIALPKGDRQRWLVEKAVEMGVTQIVPLITSRSTAAASEAPAKLLRYVIEASKQCGRNRLLEIAPPQSWPEVAAGNHTASKFLAHPGGAPVGPTSDAANTGVVLAIGPEGGFTDEEVALGREHDWQILGLGERILRIETAALALVARLTVQ